MHAGHEHLPHALEPRTAELVGQRLDEADEPFCLQRLVDVHHAAGRIPGPVDGGHDGGERVPDHDRSFEPRLRHGPVDAFGDALNVVGRPARRASVAGEIEGEDAPPGIDVA